MPPSSNPASSPLLGTSRNDISDHNASTVSTQSELRESPPKEIDNHAWEFDAERIAKMLSATDERPPDGLVNSAYNTLEGKKGKKRTATTPPVWPTDQSEQKWYPPLALFLNSCISACHTALSEHPGSTEKGSRFYNRLTLITYDESTVDRVEGASPVKLDLVGGLDLIAHDRLAWSPQDTLVKKVLIPVEVKGNWSTLVIQAATHARCLFSANPSRQFSIVIGFRHTEAELRFLVFHRGGLTASKPCSVKDSEGQKDILRIFLSILNWTSPNDAGFLEFFDNSKMSLFCYKGDETGVEAEVKELLYDGPCVRGRASRVFRMATDKGKEPESHLPTLVPTAQTSKSLRVAAQMKQGDHDTLPPIIPTTHHSHIMKPPSCSKLVWSSSPDTSTSTSDHISVVMKHSWPEDKQHEIEADLLTQCKDGFGTPHHHYSFCPTDSHGEPMSTARFLPTTEERVEDFHWAITSDSKVPSSPQYRSLWFHVNKLVGQSLVHARTPWELFLALGHGMLGWLVMLEVGFLHRDISIGNVLMLDPPVMMKPFKEWRLKLLTSLGLQHVNQDELNQHIRLLEDELLKLGSLDKCHGFVIDGDMAAHLENYFTQHNVGEVFGTYEFMSPGLLLALQGRSSHFHSPVDDLQSFYYTAQWAVAFNNGASGGKFDGEGIQLFQKMISTSDRHDAYNLVRTTYPHTWKLKEQDYGQFFSHSMVLLHPWLKRLETLIADWRHVYATARKLGDVQTVEQLGYNFLVYGYRGVGEYFELLCEHHKLLQEVV